MGRFLAIPSLAVVAALLASPAFAAGPWSNANPGAGGAFTSMGAGPSGVILCGSDLGGAYRSLDRGQTWDAIGSVRGMDVAHVSAVGFDPADPAIMYLGTEYGVFRSANTGTSWQKVSGSDYIAAVTAAPSNPSIVYAPYHPGYGSATTGLYKSTNRGVSWTTVSTNLPTGLRVTKLVVHPTDANTVYLVSSPDLFVTALASAWKSTNGGASWTRIGAAMGNVLDLSIDPSNGQILYATASGSTWKSTDGGATWVVKGSHTGCVRVKRDQPSTIWVIDPEAGSGDSESGCWISTNGGESWTRKSSMSGWDSGWQTLDWAYGGNAYGMAKVLGQDMSDPNVLFWTHWQFVFGTFDGGAKFQNLFTRQVSSGWWTSRGIENVCVTGVAISEANPLQIYTGYYDIGLWRSMDGGVSWQSANHSSFTGAWNGRGGCSVAIVPDPSRANVVFAILGEEANQATVIKSTSSGSASSWVGANGGLPSGFVYGLSLSKTSSSTARTLFVTSNGTVYKSVDDGSSWTAVLSGNNCRVTAVDRFDGNLVYAGGENGLWRSTTGGGSGSWTKVGPSGLSGSNPEELKMVQWEGVHAITPDPKVTGRVWVASYGSGRGIYRSNDQGTTWTQLRSGSYFRDVEVDPLNGNNVFATSSKAYKAGGSVGGSEGLLRSTDGGQTWSAYNEGLSWPFAGPMAVDPATPSKIIVGSPGTGFWIRTTSAPPPTADLIAPAAIRDLAP
jgi:hypothetical protein